MHRRLSFFAFTSAVATFGVLLFAPPAHAKGFESCGKINVSAEAKCEVKVKGGCETECQPLNFETACSAQLETTCDKQCTETATTECTTTCKPDCTTKCMADPPMLDCNASCQGRCDADCSGKCATAENKSECQASCKACCGGKCDGKCDATPPTATCDTKCENSCQGSCTAKVNIDCQISCQSKLYAECKTKLTGGCKTQCEKPEGALFCDGSYVDTGDNLKSCINALDAYLKAHVDVTASASGSSSCDGGTCTAQGEAKAAATVKGCSMSPDSSANGGVILAGLGIAAVLAGRRRKRAA